MTAVSKSISKSIWIFGAAVAVIGVLGVVVYLYHRSAGGAQVARTDEATPIWGRGPDLQRIEIKFPEARGVLDAASAYVQRTRSWSSDEFQLQFLAREEGVWTISVLGKEDAKEQGRMIGCGDSFVLDYNRATKTFSEFKCE